MALAKDKKRVSITVTAESWDNLNKLSKELGWPSTWLGKEIDKMVKGILVLAQVAKNDADEQRQMTEEEAKKRYEDLMRKILE
jgi:hypothetical protein